MVRVLDPELAIILQISLTEQTASKGETDDAPDADEVRRCVEEIFDGIAALDLCHAAGTDRELIRRDVPIVPASNLAVRWPSCRILARGG